MKKISLLLSVAIVPVTLTLAAAAQTFAVSVDPAVKTADHTYKFTVKAPEAGSYRAVIYGVASAPVKKNAVIAVAQENGIRKMRNVIGAGAAQGRIDAIRVDFASPAETRLITVESPDAEITKIEFVPTPAAAVPPEAAAYKPKVVPSKTRPRVLVNAAMLPDLRRKLEIAENRPVWEAVKAVALKPYSFNPEATAEVRYDENLLDAVRCKAFYYLITNDKKVGEEAVALITRYLDRVDYGVAQDISREIGEGLFSASLVYDWCYPLMSAEAKKLIVAKLYYFAAEMEIGWPPFKEPALYGHANESQLSRDLLSIAGAIYDEDPLPYQYVAYALMEVSAPAKDYLFKSGMHDQGSSYGNYRFAWDLHGLLLFRRMAGHELFSADAARVPYRWIYTRTPDGKMFKDGDDFFTVGEYTGNFLMNHLAGALFNDPTLKMEFQRLDGIREIDKVFFLATNDPELKAEDRRGELPLTCYYDLPIGSMVARTGWNFGLNADDVIVMMTGAGFYYRNHQHLDAGSFQLYYRGLLLADLGLYRGYGNPFDWNFHKSTPSHTAMLIRDPEQNKSPMGPRFSANSGTQEAPDLIPAPSLNAQLTGDFYRNGDIAARGFGPSKMTPEYSFLKADLALAYRSRVDSFFRTMVFLNLGDADTPAVMLVYDVMKLKANRIDPIFQLTSPVRPEVNGNTLTFVNGPYGRDGKLTVETLLPKQSKVELLSGRDAFKVDGKQFTPLAFYDFDSAGSRALITAAPGEEKSRFLNVLQIQDGAAKPLPVDWREKAGRIETVIADRQVNLAADGVAADKSVTFKVAAKAVHVLLLDLAPGSWILAGNGKTESVNVSSDAKSFFAVLDAGDYTLTPVAPATGLAAKAPARDTLYFDGKALAAKAVKSDKGLLLPVKALLAARKIAAADDGKQLKFQLEGRGVALADGSKTIDLGDFVWPIGLPVSRNADGEWLVEAEAAAALFNTVLYRDPWTGSTLLRQAKPGERGKFLAAIVSDGDNAAWRMLWATSRARWISLGRGVTGELVLNAPEKIAGFEFIRGDGALRRAKFKIEVSADGRSFDTVFDGESSGSNAAWEAVSFAPRTVRIIKITFDGTNENERNGLLGAKPVPAK